MQAGCKEGYESVLKGGRHGGQRVYPAAFCPCPWHGIAPASASPNPHLHLLLISLAPRYSCPCVAQSSPAPAPLFPSPAPASPSPHLHLLRHIPRHKQEALPQHRQQGLSAGFTALGKLWEGRGGIHEHRHIVSREVRTTGTSVRHTVTTGALFSVESGQAPAPPFYPRVLSCPSVVFTHPSLLSSPLSPAYTRVSSERSSVLNPSLSGSGCVDAHQPPAPSATTDSAATTRARMTWKSQGLTALAAARRASAACAWPSISAQTWARRE